MKLPCVDVFSNPYHIYSYRDTTKNERILSLHKHGYIIDRVRTGVIKTVSSAYEAAIHMCNVGADKGLEDHVDEHLSCDDNFKIMLQTMPSITPKVLLDYKNKPKSVDLDILSKTVIAKGKLLSDDQFLFHGGLWNNSEEIITTRPLSTSFCPQVALRNAEHNGKAYENGIIDLIVFRTTNTKTKVYVYNRRIRLAHEKEVLFSSGAVLTLKSIKHIRDDYPSSLDGTNIKNISVRVVEVDIS